MPQRWIRYLLSPILLPFSLFYGLFVWCRNKLFDWQVIRSVKFELPVISIGNITVGGTGKTPHAEYLISLLSSDYKTAMLSRGYKRKTQGFILANDDKSLEDIGDEPYQVFSKFKDAYIAVDPDRVDGIKRLIKEIRGLQVIILDDAFQHRYVKPGISIVLIDSNRPVYKDFLLPFGELREQKSSLRRADIVIITKVSDNLNAEEDTCWKKNFKLNQSQKLFFTAYEHTGLKPVFENNRQKIQLAELTDHFYEILLVTGIANPKPLVQYLSSVGCKLICMRFPDHHEYTSDDLFKIQKNFEPIKSNHKLILTTEKDSVKLKKLDDLPASLKDCMYYVPINVKFMDGKKNEFDELIRGYVNKK